MTKTLHKDELVHPIFFIIPLTIGSFVGLGDFELFEFWKNDFKELLPSILLFILSYLILNALNTSKVVAIKNGKIVKGIYCVPFGFIKINNSITLSNIKKIELKQDEKLFYNIIAESNNNNTLLIKSIANKIPAEKELQRITTEINTLTRTV